MVVKIILSLLRFKIYQVKNKSNFKEYKLENKCTLPYSCGAFGV